VTNSFCHRHSRIKGSSRPGRAERASTNLTPATGARTTRLRRPRSCRSSRALPIAHGSRRSALQSCHAHDALASTASHPNVRDDRDTPLVRDETARVISLIWVRREAEYFCAGDSTEKSKTPLICPSGNRATRQWTPATQCRVKRTVVMMLISRLRSSYVTWCGPILVSSKRGWLGRLLISDQRSVIVR
jgi:hypothetical protein